jgi:hypothetical protein
MIDWATIHGFDWDERNARKSADRHAVSQPEAEQVFFNNPLLILPNPGHSQAEPRFHALGRTDDKRPLHVKFTLRAAAVGQLIRIISARDMHRRERVTYEQAEKNT